MGFFDKVFKEIARPFKQIEEEAARVLVKTTGKDVQEFFASGSFISSGAQQIVAESIAGKQRPSTPKVETPFTLSGEVLSESERFRRALGERRGLRSTNVTGGVRSASPVLRPTLFTL